MDTCDPTPEPAEPCGCWACLEKAGQPIWFMVLCATCGNKRCPHAADHALECTGSNNPGQPGSAYEHGSGAAAARRISSAVTPMTTEELRAAILDQRGSFA